jgi:hypothetical protein
MQRSYLVKAPVHFADFGFFVKTGDMLVHDTSNSNRLTVYRNGEVVKAVKQTSLGLAAMQKSGFIEEVTQSKTASKAPQKPAETPKPAPKREEPKPAQKPVHTPPKRKEEPKTITIDPKQVVLKPVKLTQEDQCVSTDKSLAKKPQIEIEDETV